MTKTLSPVTLGGKLGLRTCYCLSIRLIEKPEKETEVCSTLLYAFFTHFFFLYKHSIANGMLLLHLVLFINKKEDFCFFDLFVIKHILRD